MWHNILGAACAFAGGGLISTANYFISKTLTGFKDVTPKYFTASLIRQSIGAAYIAAVYFLSPLLPFNRFALLVGAALGITLPLLAYTLFIYKKRIK